MLWEMLSGKRLFRANSEAATLQATLRAEIPPVSRLRSEVPLELDRILLRALQRQPHLRYRNASEMKYELQLYLISVKERLDDSALATLVRELFPNEIVEQCRVVNELMLARDNSLREATEAPTSTSATPTASENAMSMEVSRIDATLQELTRRHRIFFDPSLSLCLFSQRLPRLWSVSF